MTDVLSADPRDTAPPQELTWDSTLLDLISNSFNVSDNLVDQAMPPRFIRMYADRWQVNFQLSGLPDPEAQSIIDIYLTARPVSPATITVRT
jgi:hypothetical protein